MPLSYWKLGSSKSENYRANLLQHEYETKMLTTVDWAKNERKLSDQVAQNVDFE